MPNLRRQKATAESNLREQISVRQVKRPKKKTKEREGEGEEKKKGPAENLRCRIAAHSRASILSFGPVHRNLHGKLPQGEDERNASERASEQCTGRKLPANRIKFRSPATTVRCGAAEIAGYRKAGPKEI